MLNCELSTSEEVEALIQKTDGFCLGAPTLGGHMPTPVSNALGVIVKEASREFPSGVFGSFGWSGEAVDLMESRLKDGGFKFAFDAIRCKFKPTEATLQVCEESGTDLAQAVKKIRRKKQTEETKQIASGGAAAGASDTAAAVGTHRRLSAPSPPRTATRSPPCWPPGSARRASTLPRSPSPSPRNAPLSPSSSRAPCSTSTSSVGQREGRHQGSAQALQTRREPFRGHGRGYQRGERLRHRDGRALVPGVRGVGAHGVR